MSVDAVECYKIRDSMIAGDAAQIFNDLFKKREGTIQVVFGREYFFQLGLLFDKAKISGAFMGTDMVKILDDTSIITLNPPDEVERVSARLKKISHEAMEGFAKSYNEVAPEQVFFVQEPKRSWLQRLTGKNHVNTQSENISGLVEPDLFKFFQEVRAFYIAAAENDRAIYYRMKV